VPNRPRSHGIAESVPTGTGSPLAPCAVELGHDVGASGDAAKGSAAHDLAQRADVGCHAIIFLSAAIGEAEAFTTLRRSANAVLGRTLRSAAGSPAPRDEALERSRSRPPARFLLAIRLLESSIREGGNDHFILHALGNAGESGVGRGKIARPWRHDISA